MTEEHITPKEKVYIVLASMSMLEDKNVLAMVAKFQSEHPTHELIIVTKGDIPPFTPSRCVQEPMILKPCEMVRDYSDIILTKEQRTIRRDNRFRSNQHNFTNNKLKQYNKR